ncbi:1-acyl-sn-glycerol-3-phosphate acyltransferase [Ktedonobacter sp. SOSP1-85]|uniref:lysophospholipid acyltransferase family protein n=1 Tax=Ktedonobacter sp. SOSP1-85 TaxID=2778367 RepID=UPI001916950B|nr:lysophospholipid acyltransferase family protein [Ktedonobacter sp. SOSP1-85]
MSSLWHSITASPALGVVLGLTPVMLVRQRSEKEKQSGHAPDRSPFIVRVIRAVSQCVLQIGCWLITTAGTRITVEGLENLPEKGSLLIAARHYHHLYDGCILLRCIPRLMHIFVALDWIRTRWQRVLMEWACTILAWPTVLRTERLFLTTDGQEGESTFRVDEAKKYLRNAVKDAMLLLRHGEGLVIFPEAYPNVDPDPNPKDCGAAFLPFRAGFVRLVELAERDKQTRVAIVPTGFCYTPGKRRWQVTLRLGTPLYRQDYEGATALASAIEERVQELSH